MDELSLLLEAISKPMWLWVKTQGTFSGFVQNAKAGCCSLHRVFTRVPVWGFDSPCSIRSPKAPEDDFAWWMHHWLNLQEATRSCLENVYRPCLISLNSIRCFAFPFASNHLCLQNDQLLISGRRMRLTWQGVEEDVAGTGGVFARG